MKLLRYLCPADDIPARVPVHSTRISHDPNHGWVVAWCCIRCLQPHGIQLDDQMIDRLEADGYPIGEQLTGETL